MSDWETDKLKKLLKVSDLKEAQRKAYIFYGPNAKLSLSTRQYNKYSMWDPISKRNIHFGHINYEDYTKHKDEKRRKLYHLRHQTRKGDYIKNPYSAHNLSLYILW